MASKARDCGMVVAIGGQLSTGTLTVLCQARHLAYVLQPKAVL